MAITGWPHSNALNLRRSGHGPPPALTAAVLSTDDAFDQELPEPLQIKSSVHFTPLEVARQAASLLAPSPGMTVLDIGAGVGKFCLAAARAVPHATFVGVELRGHLVRVAGRLARQLRLPNVRFLHGDALDLDWTRFDSFYLYNPFAEQLFEPVFSLDRSIELEPSNFYRYVAGVQDRLARAPAGTRVVTYHGFGAPLPVGFELVRAPFGSSFVELWIKARAAAAAEAVASEAA
jgi:SAM-dependent methyltransferase